jgi:hypothetical protein
MREEGRRRFCTSSVLCLGQRLAILYSWYPMPLKSFGERRTRSLPWTKVLGSLVGVERSHRSRSIVHAFMRSTHSSACSIMRLCASQPTNDTIVLNASSNRHLYCVPWSQSYQAPMERVIVRTNSWKHGVNLIQRYRTIQSKHLSREQLTPKSSALLHRLVFGRWRY